MEKVCKRPGLSKGRSDATEFSNPVIYVLLYAHLVRKPLHPYISSPYRLAGQTCKKTLHRKPSFREDLFSAVR